MVDADLMVIVQGRGGRLTNKKAGGQGQPRSSGVVTGAGSARYRKANAAGVHIRVATKGAERLKIKGGVSTLRGQRLQSSDARVGRQPKSGVRGDISKYTVPLSSGKEEGFVMPIVKMRQDDRAPDGEVRVVFHHAWWACQTVDFLEVAECRKGTPGVNVGGCPVQGVTPGLTSSTASGLVMV